MRTAALVFLALLLFNPPRLAFLEDSLAAARTLYQSAAYDEALALLDRLRAAPAQLPAGDFQVVAQYRAYCLLALGRQAEADRAIEEVVLADPFFLPSDGDASPRVRQAFQAVRRRALPAAAQQKYAAAKAAFDRKEYAAAAEQFARLKVLLEEKDLAETTALADLRVLAAGFLDLAKAADAPPPPPAAPAPTPTPVQVPPPLPPRVYNATDPDITPPAVKRQDIPRWPNLSGATGTPSRRGILDVLIDETGAVNGAFMREPIDPRYDELLLAATRRWRYVPATRDGQPVKFMKRIQVVVQ